MHPLAQETNQIIEAANPHLLKMMSEMGLNLFFPKGILTQSAEAKQKAFTLNATAGIANAGGRIMYLDPVMASIPGFAPETALNYAPSFGLPELRAAWRASLFAKNTSLQGKRISLPVVTGGITHAVSIFADMWVDPEDVILISDKMWGNYEMIFKVRRKGRIRHYPIFTPDMRYNLRGFEAALQEAAKQHQKLIVLFNFPHNPSGYTVTESEADALAGILIRQAEAGTYVIAACDDAYFGLFYEADTLKESMFARLAGAHPNLLAVKLDGATKEDYAWGLRVGFCTYGADLAGDWKGTYAALEKKTAGCVRGTISNASHLSQEIVLKAMQDGRYAAVKAEKFEILKKRAQKVKQVLGDPKYAAVWEVYPFNSGYFMCLRLKTVDAEAVRLHLLEKYGLGLIALGKSDLRIAFSCVDKANIHDLFETIFKAIQDLAPGTGVKPAEAIF